MVENMQGALWITTMGRIVLDDHSYEAFSEPGDRKIATAKELSRGLSYEEFIIRLTKQNKKGSRPE